MTLPPAPETDLEARLRAYYRQRYAARPDSETLWARLAPHMQEPASASPQTDYQRGPRLNARPQPRPPRRVFSWVAAIAAVLVIALITTALVASHHTGTGTPTASPVASEEPPVPPPSGVYFSTYTFSTSIFAAVPPTSLYALNPGNGSVKWHYEASAHSTGGGVVLEGGVLYTIISNSKQETSEVYAFAVSDGTVRWHHPLGDYVDSRLLVEDGVVYVASRGSTTPGGPGGTAFALNASDGSFRWHRQLQGQLSLAQVVNGVAYIESSIARRQGGFTGMAFALNTSDGSVRWSVALVGSPEIEVIGDQVNMMEIGLTEGASEDSPIINQVFEARNASDGSLRWSYPGNNAKVYGVFVDQHMIYASVSDAQQKDSTSIEALDASTGSLIWRVQIAHTDLSAATVGGGVFYLSSNDLQDDASTLYALNTSNGAILWHSEEKGLEHPTQSVGGVLYNSEPSALSALNGSTGSLKWRYQTPGQDNHISAVINRVVFAVSTKSGADGTITQSTMLALNASNGRLLWQYTLNVGIASPLVK